MRVGKNKHKEDPSGAKKTKYLMFCDACGVPSEIPSYILKTYFATEKPGVYCYNCDHLNPVPDYLRKISGEL